MSLRERIARLRDLKRLREARVGKCPSCLADDVLLGKGPGNDRFLCDHCWMLTVPVAAAGDHMRDPRTT